MAFFFDILLVRRAGTQNQALLASERGRRFPDTGTFKRLHDDGLTERKSIHEIAMRDGENTTVLLHDMMVVKKQIEGDQ